MIGSCRHGNPLTNSCAFCRVEGRPPSAPGKIIPGVGRPLPTLQCRRCGYTTVYQDALRRHAGFCPGAALPTPEETARKLIDGLPRGRKSLADRIANLWRPKHEKPVPVPVAVPTPTATDEIRLENVESYLLLLCAKLGIKMPFLFYADDMVNAGACGEAGQSTIWLHRQSTLTKDWPDVQAIIRHEVAHIVVHNTPGMGNATAHGAEFGAVLVVEKVAQS